MDQIGDKLSKAVLDAFNLIGRVKIINRVNFKKPSIRIQVVC